MTPVTKQAVIDAYKGARGPVEIQAERDWLNNDSAPTPRHLRPKRKHVTHPGGRPGDTVATKGRTEHRASDVAEVHGESAYNKPNTLTPGRAISTKLTRKPKT